MTTMCSERSGSATVPGCDEYEQFLAAIQQHFAETAAGPVFTTNTVGLWDLFLCQLPADCRDFYRCHACRRFVESYGGLASIRDNRIMSVTWPYPSLASTTFRAAVDACGTLVSYAKITGVFYATDQVLGQPVTHHKGEWHHMSVTCGSHLVRHSQTCTAGQWMAGKRQDYEMLQRALAEYRVETVEKALAVLRTDALYRGEHVLGIAEWLQGLQATLGGTKSRIRENMVWRAVATAPGGFCHVKSSMIGTLLDDLQAQLPFEVVSDRFRQKMHPLQYKRPSAAPDAGNIAQAEKIIAQFGAEGSLSRRYATLDDLKSIWTHKATKACSEGPGVFGDVKAKGCRCKQSKIELPTTKITWVRFRDQVLPTAERIAYRPTVGHEAFLAFTTVANLEAPPIIQWDLVDRRNPVAWYVYSHGSPAAAWGLAAGVWAEVEALVLQPNLWHGTFPQHGVSAIAVLRGCHDIRGGASLALFPEFLKSDFHAIRSTIEAYSHTKRLGEVERPACGIRIDKTGCPGEFRVESGETTAGYRIDRWE